MRRLIVNADDLGLSVKVNDGIFRAHAEGIVSAATCLVTLEGWDDAVTRLSEHGDLDAGLHVNLTWGRPAHDAPLPGLAPSGRFRGKRGLAVALALGRVPIDELRAEIDAQVRRFSERLGAPSHVDVHQHFHAFDRVWQATLEVAQASDLPWIRFPADTASSGWGARWIARRFRSRPRPTAPPRTTDHFRGLAFTGRLDEAGLITILKDLPSGLTELMVHPGDADGAPVQADRLAGTRARERNALTAPSVRLALEEAGVTLTTFSAEAARAE